MDPDRAPKILIKYGGNAMVDESLRTQVLKKIADLKNNSNQLVIVHGGGPFIQSSLDEAGIESEFIDGLRVTSSEAIGIVEKTLKNKVNHELVEILNAFNSKAVGLSGKDGDLVKAKKRVYIKDSKQYDLGYVGDVVKVDDLMVEQLLRDSYLPVITCISSDDNGMTLNVNADSFAASIASSIKVDEFILMTDVDGLMLDPRIKESLIREINIDGVRSLIDEGVIKGGMIPKIEACITALNNGVKKVRIINGTKPEQLAMLDKKEIGTKIIK